MSSVHSVKFNKDDLTTWQTCLDFLDKDHNALYNTYTFRSAQILGDNAGFVGFGTTAESGFVPLLQPDDGVPPDFRYTRVCHTACSNNIGSTGCSLNIVFFLKMLWFFWTLPVLLQRWCLTCRCVHSLTPRGNRERPESGIYFKIFKNTIFNEHPVCHRASN